MRRFSTYIASHLFGPLLVVAFSFTGVVWLTQSLRFIDLIINKGLSFGLFLYMTVLLLPSLLTVILPISLFAAVLYTYNQLIVDREIVVLKATGLSNLRLALPALNLAGIVMVICYAINLYLMPLGFHEFKSIQFQVRNSFASLLLREGVFNTPVDGLTIYVRERGKDGELKGILVHEERSSSEPTTLMAESGKLVHTQNGPRLVLVNGNRQEVEKANGELSLLYFERYAFDFGDAVGLEAARFKEAKERSLVDLFWPADVVEERHRREFAAEGHRRLITPLVSLLFVLIGLGALFSGDFNRRGSNRRLQYAVAIAVAVQALTFGLTGLLVRAPEVIPFIYFLFALMASLACYVVATDPFRKTSQSTGGEQPATYREK